MEIDRETLADSYKSKSDDDLLELHSTGTLTDLAYNVLNSELSNRGLIIPERPAPTSNTPQRPQTLAAHWHGHASLASAFWIIGFAGGMIFRIAFHLLQETPFVLLVLFAWIPYTIFALVSIWKCAWNTSWKGWGYLARTLITLQVALAIFAVIAILLD